MSILPLSVPTKNLSQSITSSSLSFKINNIKSWAKNSLGQNIDLTTADFGSRAFCVFRNATGTIIEIMEFDPTTIASASITILKRGLGFSGDPTTQTTAYKLDWPAGTVVEFGTDVPQLLKMMSFGYTLQFSTEITTPLDSTTYYFGANAFQIAGTTAGRAKIRIPRDGTITKCYIEFRNAGTLGTAETSTVNIRLNDTTDTAITASFITSTTPNSFSKTDLAIAVVAGDFIELKWVTPAWATNPTSVDLMGVIFIE